ncbi:MAG: nicotinate-nucleotide adenylyltransferase [Deltaproteobacteria bacterium]|jgi:nicotinate-nucleotide adenylyltransferase|nr:nicotinate-nucleotide adenylyltransferase [Deltaproteobacteria bacterium]
MRVGLFGGTFNPIHLGHLRAAEEVREALGLDLVYFTPAAVPPHRSDEGLAPAKHRMAMVSLAVKGNSHFLASDVELRRRGPSYTIDTVRILKTGLRVPGELFLIVGSDAFAEFPGWKDSATLVQLCHIVVHGRPRPEQGGSQVPLSLVVLERLGYRQQGDGYIHPNGKTLTYVPTTPIPISGNLIRENLKAGRSIRYLLPYEVVDYIERHHIY